MILSTITIKKYFSYVKCNFNLVFDNNFFLCIESGLYTNKTICNWKKIFHTCHSRFH